MGMYKIKPNARKYSRVANNEFEQGAPNENIVQNHFNKAWLNVF